MKSYLKFSLEGQPYGLALEVVEEILLLPELICVPDAPGDVLGVLDRRGQTLPVIHLAKRLGITQPQCNLTDNLIIITWAGTTVGIIVNQVEEVTEISSVQIDSIPVEIQPTIFLEGVARLKDDILPLINPAHLIRSPQGVNDLGSLVVTEIEKLNLGDFYDKYVVNATAKERASFRQRRLDLAQVNEQEQDANSSPFALIKMGQETIGLPLNQVREFIDVNNPTPIPFSPAYVVGDVSLRGDILTLIDLSVVLNLSRSNQAKTQAVIANINQTPIGIVIDRVEDIIDIDTSSLQQAFDNKVGVIGTALVYDNFVTLLDLTEVLGETIYKKSELLEE